MFLPVLAPAAALSHGLGGDTDAMRVRCRLSYNSTRIGVLRDISIEKSLWPAEQSRDGTVRNELFLGEERSFECV